eukprot:TRINITY_DN429_c0_g3_i2.p1 TRINITY_DN429_c0_g3~~TRINITY_DN429_c0_g3_i2.p1  ORF type:complete len:307 (-),score=43.50 TRINITY_DN429_c0_g3_i2:121-1041(-)
MLGRIGANIISKEGSRVAIGLRKGFSACNALESLAQFNDQGYTLYQGTMRAEEIENFRNTASSIMKIVARSKDSKGSNKRVVQRDNHLYYSGGHQVQSPFDLVPIGKYNEAIIGEGISLIGRQLHNEIPEFKEFSTSCIIKRIAKDVMKLNAPLMAAMSYIYLISRGWANWRKDNSFIRTNPLSTQSILVALSDVAASEGFSYIPNSHKFPPCSFLRKVQETLADSSNKEKNISKLVYVPCAKYDVPKSNFIPLSKGDILVFSGNLTYSLKSENSGNQFLLMNLVEGRGSTWEKDNPFSIPTEMLF